MRDKPWIDPIATAEIERIISESTSRPYDVFEWGMGGSTIWFAALGFCRVFSAEHDEEWWTKVHDELEKRNLTNTWLSHFDVSQPDGWRRYEESIGTHNQQFDLVLIDGRHRVNCFLKSGRFIKPGGYIILHDSERERYNDCRKVAAVNQFAIHEIHEARSTLFCQAPK